MRTIWMKEYILELGPNSTAFLYFLSVYLVVYPSVSISVMAVFLLYFFHANLQPQNLLIMFSPSGSVLPHAITQ